MPETPPMSSRDIASAGSESANPSPSASDSWVKGHIRSGSMDVTSGSRLQRSGHGRRPSDFSMDMSKSSRISWVDDDEDVVNAMQASVWGDLMTQVAEEEKGKGTL